jgi:hypothetical protein
MQNYKKKMEETKKRGGFREGSGRKKLGRNVSVAYRISEKAREKISEYAERRGISISEAVSEIFENL